VILWLLSCEPDPVPPVVTASPSIFEPLGDARLARRISIDLRGVVPSVEETGRAEAGELDALIDEWMEDPRFEEHLAHAYVEEWLLDVDELPVAPSEFDYTADMTYAFTRTAGEEPARLIAHVAASDLPWTDIVEADWTIANDILDTEVALEWLDTDTSKEWRRARYTDGRPAGGVLMTSGLWFRYHTTLFNYNRGRAAQMAWLLLCYDFLTRPVDFIATEDNSTDGLQEAVSTNPGCLACHATLDPLAGSLFGFWPYENKDGRDVVTYHPERERWGVELTGMEPAYFGTPLQGPAQLGPIIANDPRFSMCTASRTTSRLWGRPVSYDDLPEVAAMRDALEEDWQYKAMLRAILATDEYRAGALVATATDEQIALAHPVRWLSPLSLRTLVEDLTGFRWVHNGWDQLESDESGYRLMLGGADGDLVTTTSLGPGLSRSLVIQRLAQAAAMYVVPLDLVAPPEDRLLLGTSQALVPVATGPEFDAEVNNLYVRLLSRTPEPTELAEASALFEAVGAISDVETAWESVVTVLMRDPDFWSY
jgi:hypothetical protein